MKSKNCTDLDLLLLSSNELEVLGLMRNCQYSTPAVLSKQCAIPRPTIYITLEKLEQRGLITRNKITKRKIWLMANPDVLQENIARLSHSLTGNKSDYHRMNLGVDTDVAIYRGRKTILQLFSKLIEKHGGNRLAGIQGDLAGDAWKDTFKVEDINIINTKIKEEGLITEIITSKNWFKRQIELFGVGWAENFAGRAAQVHFIDHKYLNYKSQIFIFENQLYLVSMKEEIFIEVKNKEISKLIISLLRFVEDHSPSVDVNKIISDLTNK